MSILKAILTKKLQQEDLIRNETEMDIFVGNMEGILQ